MILWQRGIAEQGGFMIVFFMDRVSFSQARETGLRHPVSFSFSIYGVRRG